MTEHVARPADPYSPDWALYYAQNPHLRRSVGAAGDDGDDGGEGGAGDGSGGNEGQSGGASGGGSGADGGNENNIDLSSVPESFRTQDGQPDLAAFRVAYDDLAAKDAQRQEALQAIPEKPDGYEFNVPSLDDLELPEGFNKENFKLEIDDKDPDVPKLKEVAHQHQLPQQAVDDIAKLVAGRELRQMTEAAKNAQEELKKLGDNYQSRLDSLDRVVRGRLPEAQAEALLNDVSSADALRAIETLLSGSNRQANGAQPGGKPNLADMSIDERLALATQQRSQKRKRVA